MNAEEIISQLKTIVNNDDYYCERAEKIDWIDVSEEHISMRFPYKILQADILRFPKGYVEENFIDTYVRCVLSNMAQHEEWDKDFWKQSESFDRGTILRNDKVRRFYSENNRVESPLFKAVTEDELAAEFMCFAEQKIPKTYTKESFKKITSAETELFKRSVKGSQAVLIGRYDIYGSSLCFAVNGDTAILLEYIFYD